MKIVRNSACVTAVVICALLCCWIGGIRSDLAQAEEAHLPGGDFGESGDQPGEFSEPSSIAVNSNTHDIYVVDKGNDRIEKFTGDGTLLCEFKGHENQNHETETLKEPTEIAVDNSGDPLDPSSEDVYVLDTGRGVIDKLDSGCGFIKEISGSLEGPFDNGETEARSISGITVGAEGTLWVAVLKGPLVAFGDELGSPYKESVTTVSDGSFPGGIGIDGDGDFYVQGGIGKFAKVTRSRVGEIFPFGSTAYKIAVDPTLNEIYLDNHQNISAFHSDGEKIENFGSFAASAGVTVDPSDGTVYATDSDTNKVYVFPAVLLPSIELSSPSEQSPHSLTLNGTVDPEGSSIINCKFEYSTATEYKTTKTYTHTINCFPPVIGDGTGPVPVRAYVESLNAETEYKYRLVVENGAKIPAEAAGIVFTGPLLEGAFSTKISSSGATLNIRLNPNGDETHYYFEYGSSTGYGGFAPSEPPGGDAGNGVSTEIISARLEKLREGEVYHYRLIVDQGGEQFEEPDREFTTQRDSETTGALDGRSWELVTPANKRGALIEPPGQGGQIQAASDGSGIAYTSTGPSLVADPAGHVTVSPELSRRTSNGWTTEDLTLPSRLPEKEEPTKVINPYQIEYHLFSPDLTHAIVEPPGSTGTPLLSSNAIARTLYIRDNITGGFFPLVTPENVIPGGIVEEPDIFMAKTPTEWTMHVLAASSDLAHVVLKTPMALTENAIDEEKVGHEEAGGVQWNLYEWSKSDNGLQLVNVLPNESPAHGKISNQPGVRLAGSTNSGGRGRGGAARSMSEDGRWVAWTWGEPYTSESALSYRGLYVRDMQEEKTMRVGGLGAIYQSMSVTGEKLFYIEGGDLYEFDTGTGTSTDLTGPTNAEVQEPVVDISEDGSYVYFVAKGALASGASAGANNLYLLRHSETGWTIAFIALLSDQDSPSWTALGDFNVPLLPGIASRVSPNGHYMAFMSNRSLTGYDNRDASSNEPDEEVFLYDAVSERLLCVSCNPTGERPHGVLDSPEAEPLLVDRQRVWTGGPNGERVSHWLAGSVPGWDALNSDPVTYQPRYLSNSGRVFFDSPDALVPQDGNGLEDVYEFEPVGVGGCVTKGLGYSSSIEGCLSLISSGLSSSESGFYDASESGDDVFFDTTAKLVSADFDKGYDLYDSHVCTDVVACRPESVHPPACESGDACKAPPSLQPEIFGPPPSATFNGVGNVAAQPSVRARSLTRVQKLARALAVCRRERGKRRKECVRVARKRYGGKVTHHAVASERGR